MFTIPGSAQRVRTAAAWDRARGEVELLPAPLRCRSTSPRRPAGQVAMNSARSGPTMERLHERDRDRVLHLFAAVAQSGLENGQDPIGHVGLSTVKGVDRRIADAGHKNMQ